MPFRFVQDDNSISFAVQHFINEYHGFEKCLLVNFAAIDIFMCGDCDPHKAIPVLQAAFHPDRIELDEQRRGRVF